MHTLKLNPFEFAFIEFNELDSLNPDSFFLHRAIGMEKSNVKQYLDHFNLVRSNTFGFGGVLPAEYTHEYNKIARDWQRKITTIGINDDIIIVVLKKVQMFKHVYTRIEGIPISINNNANNVNIVLNKLFDAKLVEKIGVLENEAELIKPLGFVFDSLIDSYNFYSHIPSNFEKINKNRWRTKKGINRILKMENFNWKLLNSYDDRVKLISEGFSKWKKEVLEETKGWQHLAKAAVNYEYWNDKNCSYYLLLYKDIPLSLCIYILINGVIAHQIVNKSIAHSIFNIDYDKFEPWEKLEFEEISKRMGTLTHYITIKDLSEKNFEHGYFGGAFSTKSLQKFKRIVNDSEIQHNIYRKE